MKGSIYCCPYCLGATGTPELVDQVPVEHRCDCFPLHGQWLPVIVNGQCVGSVLLDSDRINQMQGYEDKGTHWEAPPDYDPETGVLTRHIRLKHPIRFLKGTFEVEVDNALASKS